MQSFSENSETHGQENTHSELHEIKTYRLSGVTEKEDIKCHKPFSLSWKKKLNQFSHKKKKSTSQIVVNGYVLCLIFDSQLEILKTKTKQNKKKKIGGPASTSVSRSEQILCRGEGRTRNKYIHH